MHDVGWGWWVFMSIGMVAFWGLIIYVIVSVVRGPSTASSAEATRESPEQVLKRRLAEGEISVEEYEELSAAVERKPRPSVPV